MAMIPIIGSTDDYDTTTEVSNVLTPLVLRRKHTLGSGGNPRGIILLAWPRWPNESQVFRSK